MTVMTAISLPIQDSLVDQVTMLRDRCEVFQTTSQKYARENSHLMQGLLHRDQLLSDCAGPLDLLRRLANEPMGSSTLPANTRTLCAQLLARIEVITRSEFQEPVVLEN